MPRKTGSTNSPKHENVWEGILASLRPEINVQSFDTWLKPTRLLPSSNGKLRISVPNRDFKDYIEEQFLSQIRKAAHTQGYQAVELYPEIAEPEPAPVEVADPAEPEEERSPRFDSTECPRAPEEAWYGTAKLYREVIGHRVESSDNFHLACFLTLVGSLLGKSVYINSGRVTYPNFYTVIVGESAWSAKGTAMDPMAEIAPKINQAVVPLTSLDSSEGLIRAINDSRQAAGHGSEGCVLIMLDEMNAFLEKAKMKGNKLIPDLKKAFDSPETLQINTSKRVFVANAPTISVQAASEPDDLNTDMRDRDLKGGLGNRWIYVPGEPKPPNAESSVPTGEELEPVVTQLSKVIKFYQRGGKVQLHWSPQAYKLWKVFYDGARKRGSDDPLIVKLAARHRAYVPRIATVFAALDMETQFIQEKQLVAALAYADFLLDSLYYIFRNADIKPWVRESKDIIDYVRRKGGVPLRWLRGRFHRLGAETFERRMKYLLADDLHPERELVKESRVGSTGRSTVWVVPND